MLKIKENKTLKGLRIANVVLFVLLIFLNSMPFLQTTQSANSKNANSVYVFDTMAQKSETEVVTSGQAIYDGEYSSEENISDKRTVKVGVIEDIYKETEAQISDYKIYYWTDETDGDVQCTPLNTTEEKSLGERNFNNEPQIFYMFEAEIPANIDGYHFHIGDERLYDQLVYYTAIDLFLEVTTIVENPIEQSALSTIAWSSAVFFIVPIIGFFFFILDRERNLKNVVGLICSAVGIFAITYIAGPYLSIGSLLAILLYLATCFLSMLAICARYLVDFSKKEEKKVDK